MEAELELACSLVSFAHCSGRPAPALLVFERSDVGKTLQQHTDGARTEHPPRIAIGRCCDQDIVIPLAPGRLAGCAGLQGIPRVLAAPLPWHASLRANY